MSRVNVRYDKSYPFLALAKKHGVDYENVLLFAEGIDPKRDMNRPTVHESLFRPLMQSLPLKARMELHDLTALPVHERGGRHEEPGP